MLHALSHFFGIDTQSSHMYDFWSGVATQLPWWSGLILFVRHKNCSQRGCLRFGHPHPKTHLPVCKKHR